MNGIKCKFCGKVYSSPSEMRKRKCHSHPKGAWCGYCTPDAFEAVQWQIYEHCEELEENRRRFEQIEADEAERVLEFKKHTPLLDCVISLVDDELSEYKLKLKNADMNKFALDLANGINKENRDAINTIYALRAGCDYVLEHADARDEGSLESWLDDVRQLKDKVILWDFWSAVFWLTKPIQDAKANDDKKYKQSYLDDDYEARKYYGGRVSYWINHPIAEEFHVKQVMPMLRVLGVLRKKEGEDDEAVREKISAHVLALESKKKNVEMLSQRIDDRAFWSALYCLYWMQLRPTPWSDRKVWPL